MSSMQVISSPWWYRRRDAVWGAIYGAGFFAGWAISALTMHGDYIPFFTQFGTLRDDRPVLIAMAVMLVLTAACFALRVWGSSYLHARVVWSDNARADSLVVAGPFRFTRNPLYLGNVFMALGFGALAPVSGWLLINAANIAFIYALIRWEERGLRERYGTQFEMYCESVPRLFPQLSAAAASGVVHPSLKQGLLSEIFIGSLLLGMCAIFFAPSRIGFTAFVALYAGGIFAQRIVARKEEKAGSA